MSTTVTHVSSCITARFSSATAWSGRRNVSPRRARLSDMASCVAMPTSAHGPHAIDVARRPRARRASARASQ